MSLLCLKNGKEGVPVAALILLHGPPMVSWLQEQLRSKLTNASQFAWHSPSFSMESPTSWKAPLSQANLEGCLPYLEEPTLSSVCRCLVSLPCPEEPPTTPLAPSINARHHSQRISLEPAPVPWAGDFSPEIKPRQFWEASWVNFVLHGWAAIFLFLSAFSSFSIQKSHKIVLVPREISAANWWGLGSGAPVGPSIPSFCSLILPLLLNVTLAEPKPWTRATHCLSSPCTQLTGCFELAGTFHFRTWINHQLLEIRSVIGWVTWKQILRNRSWKSTCDCFIKEREVVRKWGKQSGKGVISDEVLD